MEVVFTIILLLACGIWLFFEIFGIIKVIKRRKELKKKDTDSIKVEQKTTNNNKE